MAYKPTKSWGSSETAKTTYDVVAEIFLKRIEDENKLPWQKPFVGSKMNWFTETEYRGINRLILTGTEYITKNQMMTYNKKNETTFFMRKGCKSEIVTFFTKTEKAISNTELESLKKRTPNWYRYVKPTDSGGWVKESFVFKYSRVFRIEDMVDKSGNTLQSKLGRTIFETHEDAGEVIQKYTKASGIRIVHTGGVAAYSEEADTVVTPEPENYVSSEAYYRTLFHELIHSTGVEKRLNRDEFRKYTHSNKERAKEEVVAEYGALLLATEVGFTLENSFETENSVAYLESWVRFIKDEPKAFVTGLSRAERAKNFILSGGVDATDTDKKINPD